MQGAIKYPGPPEGGWRRVSERSGEMARARACGREIVSHKGAGGGIGAEKACTHGGPGVSATNQDRQGERAKTAQQGVRCFHQCQVAHMSAPLGSDAGSARWTSQGRAGTAAQWRARGHPGGPSHKPARCCLSGHGASIAILGAQGKAWGTDGRSGRGGRAIRRDSPGTAATGSRGTRWG